MESIERETELRRCRGSLICFTRDYMTILTPCNAPNISAQHQHVHRVCLSLHLINRRLQNRKEHSIRFLFSVRRKKKTERNPSRRNSLQQIVGDSVATAEKCKDHLKPWSTKKKRCLKLEHFLMHLLKSKTDTVEEMWRYVMTKTSNFRGTWAGWWRRFLWFR